MTGRFWPPGSSIGLLIQLAPLVVLAAAAACAGGDDDLLLGATTSVQDPGLLDGLVAAFEEEYGYDVKPIVQGSGQVLELARNGEFDVIMTHSPADEETFINDGFGLEKTEVMRNYFQIVGPEDDPANVAGAASAAEAFERIAETGAPFVSRGDESGTYKRELSYWVDVGIDPVGESWYTETGTGQGQTLTLANDDDAYTLVDSSTFMTYQDNVDLVLLRRDDDKPNVYSVIRLNAERLDDVNEATAGAWIEFMTSQAGQRVVEEFGREEYGESLFEPLLLN